MHWLSMGGHGFYVWCSYGVVAAVLAYHYFSPLVKHKKLLAELASEQAPEQVSESAQRDPHS